MAAGTDVVQREASLLIISPAITLSLLVGRMDGNETSVVTEDDGASLPEIHWMTVIVR